MTKKACKFEDSILAKEFGWTYEEYAEFMVEHLRFKMGNDIKLTPQETKEYIECTGVINENYG